MYWCEAQRRHRNACPAMLRTQVAIISCHSVAIEADRPRVGAVIETLESGGGGYSYQTAVGADKATDGSRV